MFCSTDELSGLCLRARDGEVGRVRDVYFDSQRWELRYLVVQQGGALSGRKVLIPSQAIERVEPGRGRVEVALTREQIAHAPGIDTATPVSRQHHPFDADHKSIAPFAAADPHLRSSADEIDCHVMATDGSIGHVDDFLFDVRTWRVRYVVVDTCNWLPARRVLLPAVWIKSGQWYDGLVGITVCREAVKTSPRHERGAPVSLADEERVRLHEAAWASEAPRHVQLMPTH